MCKIFSAFLNNYPVVIIIRVFRGFLLAESPFNGRVEMNNSAADGTPPSVPFVWRITTVKIEKKSGHVLRHLRNRETVRRAFRISSRFNPADRLFHAFKRYATSAGDYLVTRRSPLPDARAGNIFTVAATALFTSTPANERIKSPRLRDTIDSHL